MKSQPAKPPARRQTAYKETAETSLVAPDMFELKPQHKFTVLKLLYLPLRARGEALRMLFRHAQIPFVSEVIPFAEWPKLKSSMPKQQLPVLRLGHDGRLLPNSMDIGLHAARIKGRPLLPNDEADAECARDCWRELNRTSLPYIDDPWGDATPLDARVGAVHPLLNFVPEETALPLIPNYLAGTQPWLETLSARLQRRPEGPFMGGAAPHHGEFATFAICDNICTLGGPSYVEDPNGRLCSYALWGVY